MKRIIALFLCFCALACVAAHADNDSQNATPLKLKSGFYRIGKDIPSGEVVIIHPPEYSGYYYSFIKVSCDLDSDGNLNMLGELSFTLDFTSAKAQTLVKTLAFLPDGGYLEITCAPYTYFVFGDFSGTAQ